MDVDDEKRKRREYFSQKARDSKYHGALLSTMAALGLVPALGLHVRARSRSSCSPLRVSNGVPRTVLRRSFTTSIGHDSCSVSVGAKSLQSKHLPKTSRGVMCGPVCAASSSISATFDDDTHKTDTSENSKSLRVAFYICTWYFLNAVFAIINKRTLSIFPHPWLLSWVQIGVGGGFMLLMWKLKALEPPAIKWNWQTFKLLAPTSVLHLIAHVTACASYSLGTVSFMQVVKAGEPAVAVMLLSLFFKRKYSKLVWLTMIPIVGGVAVGSTTELNFSLASFLCAMASNVASALRSVTSKDLQDQTGLRGINLYGAMSVVGAAILLPVSLIMEGCKLPSAYTIAKTQMQTNGITLIGGVATPFFLYLIVGGLLFHLYNQTSYQALGELQPLDISVANAVKRVVIILASVAVLRNPITVVGGVSAAVAILGTFFYSLAAQKHLNEEKEKTSVE